MDLPAKRMTKFGLPCTVERKINKDMITKYISATKQLNQIG